MNKSLIGWIAALALVAVAFTGAEHYARQSATFELKAHVADSLRTTALAQLKHTQDSLSAAQKDRDTARDSLKAKKTRVVFVAQKAAETAKTLPDTCQPVIHALEQVNDSLKNVADSALSLYDQQKQATAKLQAAAQPVVTAVNAEHEAIKAVPGRSFFAHLVPKASVGAFAGVCTDSKPCAGVGVGLVWGL